MSEDPTIRPGPDASVGMSAPLRCVECGNVALGAADGWRAYLGPFGAETAVVTFCPACASREFEPLSLRPTPNHYRPRADA